MNATQSEVWRPVPGFEGSYEVSDCGRARSIDRMRPARNGGQRLHRGKILKLHPNIHGYWGFNAIRKQVYVHRAVLESFVGPCPDGMQACHNDSDKANNHLANLRWDTRLGNSQDIRVRGSHANIKKAHCPQGHPYDGFVQVGGHRITRYCKTCRNRRARELYAAQRSA